LIETVWRAHSGRRGSFTSIAKSYWEIVVSRLDGKLCLYVRGPETQAMPLEITTDEAYVGIRFKLGSYIPHLPTVNRVDGHVVLPDATSQSFWLHGSAWEFPNYDNAEAFVDRLVRDGLLVREPVVDAALQGHLTGLALRTVQRRFLRATGLTLGSILQIERARHAMMLLQHGVPILNTVVQAGYTDQPSDPLSQTLDRTNTRPSASGESPSKSDQLAVVFVQDNFLLHRYHTGTV
jgi:hypothetical protein